MRRRGGFTLLEIIVVVMIVMLLTAVALPQMRGTIQHMRLRQAGREVASVMRLARDSAVVRNSPVEVIFSMNDKGADEYQLVLMQDDMERIKPTQRRSWHRGEGMLSIPGPEWLRVRPLPEGVYFAQVSSTAPLTEDKRRPRIIFHPDGSATGGTISVQDVRNRTMSIEIYRATGLARVEDNAPPIKMTTRTLFYGPRKK